MVEAGPVPVPKGTAGAESPVFVRISALSDGISLQKLRNSLAIEV